MKREISVKTKLACLIGYPVGHSVSPAMHNAAYNAMGFDGIYLPMVIPPESLDRVLNSLKLLGFIGCNVTIPYKKNIAKYTDQLDTSAGDCGAVNTILFKEGRSIGYNTDGSGFVRAMREKSGFDPVDRCGTIIGAGGAGVGVAFALAAAGAKSLFIVNRTESNALALADRLNKKYPGIAVSYPINGESEASALRASDFVVNTTNVGMMQYVDSVPIDPSFIETRHFVSDIIYSPLETKLLGYAKAKGCTTMNGIWMLVYQGLEAIRIWTGEDASAQVMYEAAVSSMQNRS